MCTFLYGNIDAEAYDSLFTSISGKYGFAKEKAFKNAEGLIKSDIADGIFFRITSGHCDCNTPVGGGDAKDEGLRPYLDWLTELRKCRKLKRLYIIKMFTGDKAKIRPGVQIGFKQADMEFLAGIEEGTYACIDYTKRWQDSGYENWQAY